MGLFAAGTFALASCGDRPTVTSPPVPRVRPTVTGATGSDLGSLGGGISYGYAVDGTTGQVVGESYTGASGTTVHAFLWAPGVGMRDLGTLGTGDLSQAHDVNSSGTVVGLSNVVPGGSAIHAFIWSPGTGPGTGLRDLGSLGGAGGAAQGINDAGQVVGAAGLPGDAAYHAFLWTPGVAMQDLGTLGGPLSYAYDINAAGQVVGYSNTADGWTHAFLWEPGGGGMQDLGELGGGSSFAFGINSTGQVTGYSLNAAGEFRAFLWTRATGMQSLGALGGGSSFGFGINDAGQVVGYAYAASDGAPHAFLWTPEDGMEDLYPTTGMWDAEEITNDRRVAGTGAYGAPHAWLAAVAWTPSGQTAGTTTPAGTDIAVTVTDPATGTTPATLTFADVTTAGATTVTSTSTGAPPPLGFQLGDPPVYYDLHTTATFTGTVIVCFGYAPAAFADAADLHLFHDAGSGWVDVTTSNDPTAGRICGSVTSLSPFVLAELHYDYAGFFQPVDNPGTGTTPVVNSAKAGSAIPVKFSLGGDAGLDVLAPNSPASAPYACGGGLETVIEETVAAGASGLTYDATARQYVYVWKTDKAWAGTCRKLVVTLRDGTGHVALFKLTR